VNQRYEPSIQQLQQSLSLHRSLLSLIPAPRSEYEVIRLVVDALYNHFPDYRCSFTRLAENGEAKIIYSRQSENQHSLTGKTFSLVSMKNLEDAFRAGLVNVVGDIRECPRMAPGLAAMLEFGTNLARLDVPIPDFEGKTCLLSLTFPKPMDWENATVELVREVAETVGLLLRDARTREKLLQSEALFREFAENVQAVVWMTALPENELVYVSPLYEKIWGRDRNHLYESRLTLLDTVHPEDRSRMEVALERQSREKYEQEYRIVRPDGEVRWIRDRGFHVLDEQGQPRRVVGIAEDITPLREAEHRLDASRALVTSNAKFAALGEMASGMAHEINNPLAVIHGLAVQLQELFREGVTPSPMVVESLASMEKMSNRIAVIVKGLRTFSRTNAGDLMAPADLVAIVQETAAMCEAKLKASAVSFTLILPLGPFRVRCRPAEISQVMVNLMNNAFDAVMVQGEGSVRVELSCGRGVARLLVEDTGVGVPPLARERIFQPFFTTKEVGKGTGLGLSISKGIVEAHGGVLFLDAKAKITRFVVELPSLEPR
jgi:PAS domain S-box-containing protein